MERAGREFAFTLSGVDVATGWISLEAVRNKSELAVFAAFERLRERLPFPLRGIDCDNGGEFINHNMRRYCEQERITLTRSRPYRKNDNCYIEQKNWSVVRRLVGYARFEAGALPTLEALYAVARDHVNYLQPGPEAGDQRP
ncbi:MAG: transposase family protein [Chloroflexota bacterium]